MSRLGITARDLRRSGRAVPHPRLVGGESPALAPAVGAIVVADDGRAYMLESRLEDPHEWTAQPVWPVNTQGIQHSARLDVRGCTILAWPASRAVLISGLFSRARQSPEARE